MKSALVTGDRGFVGRHMVQALRDEGYHVIGCDIADAPQLDCRRGFRRDNTRFDLVVHCAAVVGGRTMIDGEPLRLATEDLSIDAELFRWALRTRPARIVYFSSSAAYPAQMQSVDGWCKQTGIGLDEGVLPFQAGEPDATYGLVKLVGERLAAEANAEGIRTHVFRPFSGYGSDQALDYPFPAIIHRALEHAELDVADRALTHLPLPFEVWGDPLSARDWVHIDDVVGCVMASIDADDVGPMNICTGIATTFAELATKALEAAGARPTEIIGDTTKPSGVFWRVGDPTRMRQTYTPRISLDEGIERAIEELTG